MNTQKRLLSLLSRNDLSTDRFMYLNLCVVTGYRNARQIAKQAGWDVRSKPVAKGKK